MTTTIANVTETLVQLVATALPNTDAGWTSHPEFEVEDCEEGVGQVIGSLLFHLNCGTSKIPSATSVGTQALTSYHNNYARLLGRDEVTPGAIVVGGKHYNQMWVGVTAPQTTVPDGSSANPGGKMSYRCQGLPSILDSIYVNRGWEMSPGVGSPIDPGYCPLFNALPSKNQNTFGDRKLTTTTVNGQTVYVHDRGNPGNAWTGKQIVDLLLAGYAQQALPPAFSAVGTAWKCTDALGVLNYIPDKLDLHGKTVLEALNALINPRRGCTWEATFSVIATVPTITITVFSCSPVAYTAGSYSVPASTTTCALDSRDNQLISGLTFVEDPSTYYDVIQVEGNQPLAGISLYFKMDNSGSLVKGWNSSLEATFDPTLAQGPEYDYVFRRFLISPAYNGSQYNAGATDGMRNNRIYTTAGSTAPEKAQFGVGGYKGTRAFLDGGTPAPAPDPISLKIEKFLPLPALISYATTPAAGSLDMSTPLLAPLLFIKDGSSYTDITDDFTISVEEQPAAISLSGDIAELQTLLTATAELVVTVGIRESMPLMCSYQATSFQRDLPRVLVRRMPYCEQWIGIKNTVMGVTAGGGGFDVLTADLTSVNDLEKLTNWLGILRVWYQQMSIAVSWTDHSKVDISRAAAAFRPGALLTTAHRGDANLTVNAVITSRRWRFKDGEFSTSYTTQRIVPDLESTDGHPMKNLIWRSNAERDFLDKL